MKENRRVELPEGELPHERLDAPPARRGRRVLPRLLRLGGERAGFRSFRIAGAARGATCPGRSGLSRRVRDASSAPAQNESQARRASADPPAGCAAPPFRGDRAAPRAGSTEMTRARVRRGRRDAGGLGQGGVLVTLAPAAENGVKTEKGCPASVGSSSGGTRWRSSTSWSATPAASSTLAPTRGGPFPCGSWSACVNTVPRPSLSRGPRARRAGAPSARRDASL